MNHEEQYSIWPADRENACGWRDADKSGPKADCLAYIKEVWTDMRPLSLHPSSRRFFVRVFQLWDCLAVLLSLSLAFVLSAFPLDWSKSFTLIGPRARSRDPALLLLSKQGIRLAPHGESPLMTIR